MSEVRLKAGGYGGYSGWYYYGKRKASDILKGDDFWSKAARIAASAEGGKMDAVQCYDRAIMTAGPLQSTALFGYLQALLNQCAIQDVDEFCERMGPAMYASGVYVRENKVGRQDAKLYWSDIRVGPIEQTKDLRKAFFAGGTGKKGRWNPEQKKRAQHWLQSLARLFGDEAFDEAQSIHAQWLIRKFWRLKTTPKSKGEELAACFLAFAINHPAGAQRILRASSSVDQYLALASKRAFRTPKTFPNRVARTRAALRREF